MGLTQAYPVRAKDRERGRHGPQGKTLAAPFLCVLLLVVPSIFACGAPRDLRDEPTVMLDVVDAPLNQVVRMLTQQSGVNIIIGGDADLSSKKITAHVDGLPLAKVLDYVVTSAGVGYKRTGDGTYLIGATALGGTIEATSAIEEAEMAQPVPAAEATETAQPKRRIVSEVIKLVHSAPRDILTALGVRSGRASSPDMDEVYPWKPTTPDKALVHTSNNIYVASQEPAVQTVPPALDVTGNTRGEAERSPTESEGAHQYTPTVRPGAGYPGATRTATGATAAAPTTTTTQQGLLPPDIDFIMAYDIDNSLIVRGTPEAIADLKDLISRYLDIPPKQVSIKAEFIEVSTSDVNRLGIDWQIERLNKTFSTAFNPSGNVVVGIQTGNVAATLRAELTTGKGRVVNSPIISTLNNTPAYITIGKYIPYWTTTYQASTTTTATTSTMNTLPVQTYLFVLPRVNGDNSITLYLEPTVQDTGQMYKGPNGEEFPETRNQSLRANRRIMNGETIVVGGFIRRADTDSTSEVPLLGRLPIIGPLFRSTSRSQSESELLIFLTPTIIPEKGGTTLGVIQ